MPDTIMPQIKKIVFLMLENRSLDSVLGWLYEKSDPEHVFPPDSRKDYDGLREGAYSNPDTDDNPVPVTKITPTVWADVLNNKWGGWYGVPYYDPWEALRAYPTDPRHNGVLDDDWKGVLNQFYGNSKLIPGLPVTKNGNPAMKGFLQDYYYSAMYFGWQGHDILWTHSPEQLRVINSLARNYAVSDRWFSSVPTETNPNRAYSLCGTSIWEESNGPWYLFKKPHVPQQYNTLTLFNQLAKQGKSWKLYYSDEWANNVSYTEYTFPQIPPGHSADINTFYKDADAGTLPDFTYIEPHWSDLSSGVGTDYHPYWYVIPGESFLQQVFTHLRSGKDWKDMLFVVTFDEHGGTYDHVPPPGTAINPDGIIGVENGFKFDQYGARVPTLLISPYIRKGTVFRSPGGLEQPFDHTSFIKTVLMWAGMTKEEMNLGKRVYNASTFEGVLSDQRVNDTADCDTPCTPTGEGDALHPAGTYKELQPLMVDVPGAATKAILRTCNTKEEIVAAVADYRKEAKKF